MSRLKGWVLQLIGAFQAAKQENLDWQQQHQTQIQHLKQAQALAEQELAAQLRLKATQLAHELELLAMQNATELEMLKTKCSQDIKDYQQYLDSLEQLKLSIQRNYSHLPAAVAFTIHHHAKHLLNQMWETPSLNTKMQLELQLINLMAAVHEDVRLYLENPQSNGLPEKTLALMQPHAYPSQSD